MEWRHGYADRSALLERERERERGGVNGMASWLG